MAVPARWIRIEAEDARDFRVACDGFGRTQSAQSAPAVLWARDVGLAVVTPLKFAPGHRRRWSAWGLAPLLAAFRLSGLRAYLEEDGLWLSGRRIASSEAWTAGACVVVAAGFTPPGAQFLDTVRARIEAQHGWQFDHCWPSSAEKGAMLEQANAA
jgi:hypothetical protein